MTAAEQAGVNPARSRHCHRTRLVRKLWRERRSRYLMVLARQQRGGTGRWACRTAGSRGPGLALGLWLGTGLDALAGDPRRAHPVAMFGRAASVAESRLWADSRLR